MKKGTINRDEQVKQRAFELWQQHGSQEGYQSEFWAQAERELKGEGNTIGITANSQSAKSGSGPTVQVSGFATATYQPR